jgi:CubicO group peptidase (beta-lactamase class C family)
MRTALPFVVVASSLCACVAPAPTPPPLTGRVPTTAPAAPPGPVEIALPRSPSPEAQGVSSAGIVSFLDALEQAPQIEDVDSVMVLRHGQVVAEGWWAPYRSQDVHTLYSVSKSFNSTAAGFAIAEGLLNLQDTVVSFFPEYVPENPSANLTAMRVVDLLTMSAGHQTDTIDRIKAAPDELWVKAFFQLPVERQPGTFFLARTAMTWFGARAQKELPSGTVGCH